MILLALRRARQLTQVQVDRSTSLRSYVAIPATEYHHTRSRSVPEVIEPNITIEFDRSSNIRIESEPQSEVIASDKVIRRHLPTLLF